MDVAIVGDAQPVPLTEREEFQQLDSVLTAIMLFGMPLPAPDAGRYASEMMLAAELPGVPRDIIPTDVAALDRSWQPSGCSCAEHPLPREASRYVGGPETGASWRGISQLAHAPPDEASSASVRPALP